VKWKIFNLILKLEVAMLNNCTNLTCWMWICCTVTYIPTKYQ